MHISHYLIRHFTKTNFLALLEESGDKGVSVKAEHVEKILKHLKSYESAQEDGLLLEVPFTTLSEYLWLLRACCENGLRPLGKAAGLYLAAAVADFYIPSKDMPEHKMQSAEGAPEVIKSNFNI